MRKKMRKTLVLRMVAAVSLSGVSVQADSAQHMVVLPSLQTIWMPSDCAEGCLDWFILWSESVTTQWAIPPKCSDVAAAARLRPVQREAQR